MKTKFIWVTPEAENVISYCARVSSPKNQTNYDTAPKLLKYCIKNKHWSIFEQASMCIEINTSRAISAQILRHKSMNFQEFSQRYQQVIGYEEYEARLQDSKNRQNSLNTASAFIKSEFEAAQQEIWDLSKVRYDQMLKNGVAKECARFLLPLNTSTRMYVSATVRSWITYLMVRCGPETQKEHRDVADECKKIFIEQFPSISEALEWDK